MEDFDLFEQYLEDLLNPDEKASFERRLKEDPELLNEFDHYRLLHSDMQLWYKTADKRDQLNDTIERITGKKKTNTKIIPFRRYLLRAAAAVIILGGLWWWFFVSPNAKTNNELFAQYSAEERIANSRGDDINSAWAKAAASLYDKKYTDAISTLQQIIASGKDSTQEATAWLGYCFMLNNDEKAAENIFTNTNFKQKPIADRAKWYQALLYLKTGQKNLCITLLTNLQSSGGDYANKAAALLKEIIH